MLNKKVYFDANIVLDIIDVDRRGHKIAKKLWKNLTIGVSIYTIEEFLKEKEKK